jgi:hypothetical protein
MPLPHIDFELTYWRLRRRVQRIRGICRYWASRARAQAHLHYLHQFGRLPERPEPEDTLIFRGLVVVSVVSVAAILAFEFFRGTP